MYPIFPKSSTFLKCSNTVIGGDLLYLEAVKVELCWYFDEKFNISYFSAWGFLWNKYKCSRVPHSTESWESLLWRKNARINENNNNNNNNSNIEFLFFFYLLIYFNFKSIYIYLSWKIILKKKINNEISAKSWVKIYFYFYIKKIIHKFEEKVINFH